MPRALKQGTWQVVNSDEIDQGGPLPDFGGRRPRLTAYIVRLRGLLVKG
jgi:hypothetical protein